MNATKIFRSGLATLLSILFFVGLTFGQTLKNKGVYRNTGTSTFSSVQNYRTGTAGTILNSGSLSTTTTLDNDDGLTAQGTIRNYIGGVAAGTLTVGTDFTNEGGTYDNDSTDYVPVLNVGGAITSTGTFDTDAGKVVYNAAGAQNIFTTTYGALVAGGSGTKTLQAALTVNDSARIMDGATLAISTFEIDLKGSANVLAPTGTLSASSGTVDYSGDRDQSMFPGTYKTLTLTGSTGAHTKTSPGAVSFAASGALTVSANDTFYVSSGNLDLSTNTPSLTNNEVIKVAGNATFHGGITDAGDFYYAGTSSQNIGSVSYAELRLGGSGAKVLPSGTLSVTGNYIIDAGTGARDYTTNSNTFQFAGTGGSQTISGLSETFHILAFAGSSTKTLGGTAFGAARLDVLGTSGIVTNNVTTVTLTNVAGISLTIASGAELVNSASKTITMNGDLELDGILTNAGTISVY